MKLLIYLLGIIGSVGSLVYSFNFSSNNHFIFISCIIVGLLIYLGFNYIQGKKKFVIGSIIADGILLLIPSTMDCLTYITSIIIYKYREVSVYDFNFESTYIFYDDPQICILAFLLIFIPLFLSAVIAIDKQKYTLAILALLPGVFIELLFTITPPWYFLACYVLYVLILLIGALQKGAILKIPMIIISVVAMAITYISFPISTYRPSKYSLFDNARTPISTPGNIKEEYNVNSQGDRHYRNSLDFTIAGEVTLNNFKIRGIAYDLYEDGKWGTSHSRVETEWFKNNLEKIANITKTSRQVIEVNQISGYSQRNYTPYFIINDDMTYYGDHYEGKNPQTYEMIIPNDDFNALLSTIDYKAKGELLKEIAERNGTQDYYDEYFGQGNEDDEKLTSVPEETKSIIENFLKQHNVIDNGNIFNYITQCTNALAANTSYTLRPGNTPDNVDVVDYFLNTNKKGYCVHYASTLALMLRSRGYPARFVVGYQVPGSKNNAGKLIVRDSNAHAWVEIYDEYLGGTPIEATPTSSENPNTPTDTITPAPNQGDKTPQPVEPEKPNIQQISQNDSFQIPVYIYYLAGGMIFIFIVLFQARIRKKRMFKGAANSNQKVCYYYYYLTKLKINCDVIKTIIDKARFSQHQISIEELEIVEQFYQDKTNAYFKQANLFKKIYLRYLIAVL